MSLGSAQPGRIITILSTDTKPTLEANEAGTTLKYTDTGAEFEWSGSAWYQTKGIDSSGNLAVKTTSEISGTVSTSSTPTGGLNVRITTATSTNVKSAAGVLHKIIINTAATAGIITVYDDTTGGTTTPIIVIPAAKAAGTIFEFNTAMSNGIQVVTASADDILVVYA